jgi:hypothetical protein
VPPPREAGCAKGQTFEIDAEHVATILRALARQGRRIEDRTPTEPAAACFGDFPAGRELGRESGLARRVVAEEMAEIGAGLARHRGRLRRLHDDVSRVDDAAASALRRVAAR